MIAIERQYRMLLLLEMEYSSYSDGVASESNGAVVIKFMVILPCWNNLLGTS